VKITPAFRLYALGAVLLLSLAVCARQFHGEGEAFPVAPLLVAGAAYLLAVRTLFHIASLPKVVVAVCLGLAALWHIAFLAVPTGSDDDVRRYVWDGRMQHLGYNPYSVVPKDPAVSQLHTAETRTLNHADLPSPYPPGAQLFFRAVTAMSGSTRAMRIALVMCNVAVVFVLLGILRSTGQGAHWVLAFAWNPLLATEVAGSGHIDILGALLLVISFAALTRRWRTAAAITFALAVGVKFLPIVLFPLYWRRVRVRDAAIAATVFALLYLPFLDRGRIPTGSLSAYIQSFRFNDPIFIAFERLMSPATAAGLAAIVGVLVAIWLGAKSPALSPKEFAWPMAASLLCAPVIYPWYLLWLLPFVRSVSTLPLIVWTVSIIPTYIVWRLRSSGHPWILPGWVMPLEYGSIAVITVLVLWLRRGKSPATHT